MKTLKKIETKITYNNKMELFSKKKKKCVICGNELLKNFSKYCSGECAVKGENIGQVKRYKLKKRGLL